METNPPIYPQAYVYLRFSVHVKSPTTHTNPPPLPKVEIRVYFIRHSHVPASTPKKAYANKHESFSHAHEAAKYVNASLPASNGINLLQAV